MKAMVTKATRCVMCGAGHTRASMIDGDHAPENGDGTMCLACGNFLIFDDGLVDGLRPPTPAERRALVADGRAEVMQMAWRAWRRSRSKSR